MVRFSDMLGGGEDAEGARAATVPNPVPNDAIPEPDDDPEATDDPGDQNPEAVLDRLTQYATSARAPEPVPEPVAASEPEAVTPDDLTPVGDDLLPHGKADTRKRRRK